MMDSAQLFHEAETAAALLDRQTMRNALVGLLAKGESSAAFSERLIGLAGSVGEGGVAMEAARRFSLNDPKSLERYTLYCETLAQHGREAQALALLHELPPKQKNHPAASFLLGLLHAQSGDFAEGERWLRLVIDAGISVDAAWSTLSGMKRFASGDADLTEMRRVADRIAGRDPRREARIGYAIGKAEWDLGEHDKSFDTITSAASLQAKHQPFDSGRHEAFVEQVITRFDRAAIDSLAPSRAKGSRSLFVTGLPRSGTTLAEKLLAAHPDVRGGGELNLWGFPLFRTETPDAAWAQLRDQADSSVRVWERLACSYGLLTWNRFPEVRHVVDKSLLQSHHMGLLLHALPDAKVIYMERDPVDTAWSCLRSYFPGSLHWTNNLQTIGRYFAAECALMTHWKGIFGDRILTISHADLVHSPLGQSEKMMQHFNLRPPGEQLYSGGGPLRIKTASMFQARQGVDTGYSGNSQPIRERLLPALRAGIEASPFKKAVQAVLSDLGLESVG